jgi:steroid 5-alpha reductase family enzyme
MGATELFAATALTVAGCMLALWLLSVAVRDASIVDVFWGLGFVAIAGLSFLLTAGDGSSRRGLIAAMASLWGLRLAAYLLWRNAGRGEDPRYAAMRRRWGERFWWVSLFSVFALQGVVMWIVSLPVQLGQLAPGAPLGALDALGFALWALGLGFESVGDFCAWWGIFLVALSTRWGIWSVFGPALLTFFLLRVSGVPLLERDIEQRRPGYAAYVARTSAFFPRPPRRTA